MTCVRWRSCRGVSISVTLNNRRLLFHSRAVHAFSDACNANTGLNAFVVSETTLSVEAIDLELAELYVELLDEVLKNVAVLVH